MVFAMAKVTLVAQNQELSLLRKNVPLPGNNSST